MEKLYKRHVIIYKLVRAAAKLITRVVLGFRACPAVKVEGPCIVVCNHTTDWDPFMIACCFAGHMYFVASDQVYQKGLVSKMLRWAVAPISRIKGATDGASAMSILRTVKRGANVCIFPEGNRTWNGLSLSVHPTTGRLVKSSRANLVTFRIKGGYLTSPRWSSRLRRGKTSCECVGVYSPDELQGMSFDEINELIGRDIFEDALQTQRESPVRFGGRNLAECLETALYVCPKCRGVCTLKSTGGELRCACGFSVTFNEYGFFEGDCEFDTIAEWDAWQERFMLSFAESRGDAPIYSDDDQLLCRLEKGHRQRRLARGRFSMYRDRITLGDFSLKLDEISQMSVFRRDTINFSSRDGSFELTSPHTRSARKYATMFGLLRGQRG